LDRCHEKLLRSSVGDSGFERNWWAGADAELGKDGFVSTNFFLSAKFDEAFQGAIILARAAGFMARQEFEHAGLVGKGPDSVGGARGRVSVYALPHQRLFSDLAGDAGTFESQETALTPEADGHVLDEGVFDSGGR
jgi:hypothetical protein